MRPTLSVTIAPNLVLLNPVMSASGTFAYGVEYGPFFDIHRLGAMVCKGTTLEPREGNPQPRTIETVGGMLNSIGLQNMGVERLVADMAPIWAKWRLPVLVNIAGERVEDYAKLARRLDGVPGVAGIEVNISCPNVSRGSMEFGTSPSATEEVLRAVRGATSLPVVAKLSPNITDITETARAAEAGGADAISLINTLAAMDIDAVTGRAFMGGLSGPAVKPVALRMVYRVVGAVQVPIIGCGGIATGRDAAEFLMAGATAVQVGTANLANPKACLDVLEGLLAFMEESGMEDVSQLIGAAR
ncbi:MAG: dihydroorotate dehydrogenase [Dehalococcoidia bacterium]|nr:dihydroorotate dehydrogenase [Dehalococcoidia bacterium]MDP6783202.1 dihydroorotate dehydrogenase [Dehalococcoidia bacterium]